MHERFKNISHSLKAKIMPLQFNPYHPKSHINEHMYLPELRNWYSQVFN